MKSAYWIIFQNDRLLIAKNNTHTPLIAPSDLSLLQPHFIRHHALKYDTSTPLCCAELEKDFLLPADFETISLRSALDIIEEQWYTAVTSAYSILNWDNNHQFCGRCGHITEHTPQTFERHCTQCGLVFYPRISPSVIVLIRKGDHLLMARSPHFKPGAYGLIAGFVEVGESLEETIHREVKEEVGITVNNIRYFKSQSWPFPDSLMIGFFADYVSGDIQIDNVEIEAADWYHYDNLPGRPSTHISLSSKLIDHFIAEKKAKQD